MRAGTRLRVVVRACGSAGCCSQLHNRSENAGAGVGTLRNAALQERTAATEVQVRHVKSTVDVQAHQCALVTSVLGIVLEASGALQMVLACRRPRSISDTQPDVHGVSAMADLRTESLHAYIHTCFHLHTYILVST